MVNVAFVCLGNICRSPMGELIFKKLVEEEGLSASIKVASFGTSDWEEGSRMYPPAKRTLEEHGIEGDHTARQLKKSDIMNTDYILVMDSQNLIDVLRIAGERYASKVFKLCSFAERPRDVADPWYTRDFERAYSDITDGCKGFLKFLKSEKASAFAYDGAH